MLLENQLELSIIIRFKHEIPIIHKILAVIAFFNTFDLIDANRWVGTYLKLFENYRFSNTLLISRVAYYNHNLKKIVVSMQRLKGRVGIMNTGC